MYYNADRTTGKLTLPDINTTPKELKTEWVVAANSCFSLLGARQYGLTKSEVGVVVKGRTIYSMATYKNTKKDKKKMP